MVTLKEELYVFSPSFWSMQSLNEVNALASVLNISVASYLSLRLTVESRPDYCAKQIKNV